MNAYCSCGRPMENRDTGLCASCGALERKRQRNAMMAFAKPDPKRINPRSEGRAKEESEYLRKAKAWLRGKGCALKEHATPCNGRLTVHHEKGRIGDLLLDENYWLPVCLDHHRYIELHPTEAYANGWSLLRTANEPHII